MFELSIHVITAFLVQFEFNLHLRVFQRAKIALAEAACATSAFQKVTCGN